MRTCPVLTFLLLAAACGATSPPPEPPGSRGPRADEHLDAAQAHARRAAAVARWLDARRGPDARYVPDHEGVWYRALEMSRQDERETTQHRGEAARLQAEYETACRGIPAHAIGRSPLGAHAVGWFHTRDGVTVLLSPRAGDAGALTHALRCHRAWLMLGASSLEHSLLDLDGLDVVAYGDRTGISVELSVRDPQLTAELQRRAAHELAPAGELVSGR